MLIDGAEAWHISQDYLPHTSLSKNSPLQLQTTLETIAQPCSRWLRISNRVPNSNLLEFDQATLDPDMLATLIGLQSTHLR